jgi:Phospholipase_D-nuclease N-terminal
MPRSNPHRKQRYREFDRSLGHFADYGAGRSSIEKYAEQDRGPQSRRIAMLFQGGFSFSNFLADVLAVFVFVVWFWLLIVVVGDLFRRHDISGWGKALWVIVLILASYIGIFAYLISQGRGMAERNMQRAEQAREEVRRVVGFSVADEIEKLDRLKKSQSITSAEFERLRARLVQ